MTNTSFGVIFREEGGGLVLEGRKSGPLKSERKIARGARGSVVAQESPIKWVSGFFVRGEGGGKGSETGGLGGKQRKNDPDQLMKDRVWEAKGEEKEKGL